MRANGFIPAFQQRYLSLTYQFVFAYPKVSEKPEKPTRLPIPGRTA